MAGAPFDGLVISAGIPELEDAVGIIEDLHEAGITHVVFKPGTVKQIRQVLAIAREVDTTVIAHIEGGVAGGHHSWEDLDELLLATYPDLRSVENLVVCVGGGIGTPERGVDYLTGRWALAHGEAAMPVDGVLIGTAAMATKEATTSAAVKQLLVETPGITRAVNGGWVGAGRSAGSVTSGRSQLGADIHEIDNAASRCGALLDEVAGDAEAAARPQGRAGRRHGRHQQALLRRRRRDDLRAVAPPLPRAQRSGLVSSTDGLAGSTSPSARASRSCSTAPSRACTPRPPVRSSVPMTPTPFGTTPSPPIDTLVAAYPEAATCVLHPADVHFFIEVCRRPGKPVNFVPVIDADVRRWWRSDSLWQAHDESYGADQVIVIPGPVAVGGITVVDEPVADLLDRFEAAIVEDLQGHDTLQIAAASRTTVGEGTTLLDAAFDSPDVVWAGRVVPNPLHRLEGTSFALVPDGDDSRRARGAALPGRPAPARRPVRRRERSAAGDLHGGRHRRDGCPAGAHRRRHPARGRDRLGDTAVLHAPWSPDLVADHIGVTSPDAHPPRRRCRRPGGAGRPRRARRSRLAGGLRLHRCGRGSARPGPPRPPHRRGDRASTARPTRWRRAEHRRHPRRRRGHHGRPGHLRRRAHQRRRGARRDPARALHGARPHRLGRAGRPGLARARTPRTSRGPARPVHRHRSAPHGCLRRGQRRPQPAAHRRRRRPPRGLRRPDRARHVALRRRAARCRVGRRHPPPPPDPQLAGPLGRPAAAGRRGGDHRRAHRRASAATPSSRSPAAPTASWRWSPRPSWRLRARRTPSRARASRARAWASRPAPARPPPARSGTAPTSHTREALGFSILAVVRDNPTELWADGELHRHPDGVLFLTQFTQVAMATLAVAQVAEMREAGVFVEDAITCGHSVGEYNALAAVTGILPARGAAGDRVPPRHGDAPPGAPRRRGPEQLPPRGDPSVADRPGRRRRRRLRRRGLRARPASSSRSSTTTCVARSTPSPAPSPASRPWRPRSRSAVRASGGKPAFILVPGIDVPFHSSELHAGVDDFRARLDELLPETIDPSVLIGRYIPNLVPRLFTLDRSYVEEVAEYVDSPAPQARAGGLGDLGGRPGPPRPRPADRAARVAVRQPGALDRDPGPAVRLARARWPGHGAVRRGRRGQRTDAGQPGRADDQAPVVRRGRAEDRELLA